MLIPQQAISGLNPDDISTNQIGVVFDAYEQETGYRPYEILEAIHSCDGCGLGTLACYLVMENLEDQFCYCPKCRSERPSVEATELETD